MWRDPADVDEPEECDHCAGVYAPDGHEPIAFPEQCECRDCGHYWEPDERPEVCPKCGSDDIGGIPCPDAGIDAAERADGLRAAKGDRQYDEMRERQIFGE